MAYVDAKDFTELNEEGMIEILESLSSDLTSLTLGSYLFIPKNVAELISKSFEKLEQLSVRNIALIQTSACSKIQILRQSAHSKPSPSYKYRAIG